MNFGAFRYASEQALIVKALILAYHNTTYRVSICGEPIDIRIGCRQFRLDELLCGKPWAFISACNPGSVRTSDNPERHRALLEKLDNLGYEHYPGTGIPDGGDWLPEESVLVAGISELEAIRIGREFGQNAIVCGEGGEAARLVVVS